MRRSVDMPRERRRGRRGVLLVLALGVAAVLVVVRGDVPCDVLAVQPACEVVVAPGPAVDTHDLVTISRAASHPSAGTLVLTTIAVDDRPEPLRWLRARMSASADALPREVFYPPGTDGEDLRRRNEVAMADSQLSATIAALSAAGYDLRGEGARVVLVADDAVTDELHEGDVIVAFDDVSVHASDEVVEAVRSHLPGDVVRFDVRRDGGLRTVEVELGSAPDDAHRGYVGVLLTTEIDLPVDVDIDAGAIGGPSAGLMFALTILDRLDPVDLTGGAVVAGTGTVDRSGRVAAVGGVRQKVVGATQRTEGAPADVFLVPRGNLDEALSAPAQRPVLVVPVDDLDGALAVLDALRDGDRPADAVMLEP